MSQAALSYAESKRESHLDDLKALIRIPSISGMSDYHPEVRRAAEWLAEHIRTTIGISNAVNWPVGFVVGL
jgi:acetylornithine deacetylase/succinyl-diaminopimelate desuccinylase-like protein